MRPLRFRTVLLGLALGLISASPGPLMGAGDSPDRVRNVVVYYEPGRFAGWPANNGVWNWGNEILVGFHLGYYQSADSGHSIDRDKPERIALARSQDGGETWKVELPDNFGDDAAELKPAPGGIRFTDPNFAMRVSRERFLISYDRGHQWAGPYDLGRYFDFKLTSRTDYLVNGTDDCLLFLSGEHHEVKAAGYRDRAFCARTTDGGKTFQFVSWMTAEPFTVRSVMPVTARVAPTELVSLLRRRESAPKSEPDRCWIDAYVSKDNGATWKFLSRVADVPGDNGNPPSLAKLPDGRLCAAWASRSKPYGIRAKVSCDNGRTWSNEIRLREDGRTWDLGYTRTVVRPDGKLVSIYYYTTADRPEQHIAASIWDPSALSGNTVVPADSTLARDHCPPSVIPLWSGQPPGARGTADADVPMLKAFLPDSTTKPLSAVVICPGGGYQSLVASHEGESIAQWLSQMGVACFVLKYRLPGAGYQHPIPLLDARRALSLVRSRANEWRIDPHRIGIMGFSAGGHLASTLSTHYTPGDPDARDPIDRVSNRPDFAVLLYPVISMQNERLVHPDSRRRLLGSSPDPKLLADLSNDTKVTADTPPTFLAHAADDDKVHAENSLSYCQALLRAGISVELHVFENGGHGFANPNKSQSLARDTWRSRCADWMRARGLMQ